MGNVPTVSATVENLQPNFARVVSVQSLTIVHAMIVSGKSFFDGIYEEKLYMMRVTNPARSNRQAWPSLLNEIITCLEISIRELRDLKKVMTCARDRLNISPGQIIIYILQFVVRNLSATARQGLKDEQFSDATLFLPMRLLEWHGII